MQLTRNISALKAAGATGALVVSLSMLPQAALGAAPAELIRSPEVTVITCQAEASVPLMPKHFVVPVKRGGCVGAVDNEQITPSAVGSLRGRPLPSGECGWKLAGGRLRLTLSKRGLATPFATIEVMVDLNSPVTASAPVRHGNAAYTSVATLAGQSDRARRANSRTHCPLPSSRWGTMQMAVRAASDVHLNGVGT